MKTTIESIIPLFERDLNTVINNLNEYEKESDIWLVQGGVKNSAGNLALHIIGNLRHFIGHILGGTSFERDREAEFGSKDVNRLEIIEEIELTKIEIKNVLEELTTEEYHAKYPLKVLGYDMATSYFIIHLYGHLNYHLGQINYHRRMIG